MPRIYTRDEIQEQMRKLVNGEITKCMMTTKEWKTFKRRMNRNGYRRPASSYRLSSKDCTPEQFKQKKLAYAKEYNRKTRERRRAATADNFE